MIGFEYSIRFTTLFIVRIVSKLVLLGQQHKRANPMDFRCPSISSSYCKSLHLRLRLIKALWTEFSNIHFKVRRTPERGLRIMLKWDTVYNASLPILLAYHTKLLYVVLISLCLCKLLIKIKDRVIFHFIQHCAPYSMSICIILIKKYLRFIANGCIEFIIYGENLSFQIRNLFKI